MSFISFTNARRRALISASTCCAVALLLAGGCSLDERELSYGHAGAGRGGAASGGAAGNPGGSGTSDAGASAVAGQAGEGGDASIVVFPDGCADLDHDGISDCTQTLLKNPAFPNNVMSWSAETGASIAWDSRDLLGSGVSGSARITSSVAIDAIGSNLVAVDQCVPVESGKIIDVFANARIDPTSVDGAAAISLWFFPNPDCPGDTTSDAVVAAQTAQMGETVTLHGTQAVPEAMVSLRVRLAAIKPFKVASFSVLFDNVLIVER